MAAEELIGLMQCDETRPVCVNCGTSSRSCVYALTPASLPGQKGQDGHLKPPLTQQPLTPGASSLAGSASGPSPSAVSPGAGTPASHASQLPEQPRPTTPVPTSFPSDVQPANIPQLELFHHVCNHQILYPLPTGDATVLSGIIEAALAAPYLMNALLAVAALHISHLRPTQSAYYHHQAVHFQTHALSLFNDEKPHVTPENALSLLLFSQFTSLQVLHEITLNTTMHDDPLDRFLDYLKVYRGVVLVTNEAWTTLLQSKLSHFFANTSGIAEHMTSEGEETAELRSFVSISRSLSNEQKQYCQDSIDRLQWIISRSDPSSDSDSDPKPGDLCRPGDGSHLKGHRCLKEILAWPCLARESFLDLLCSKNPETLLILAYYGVAMHQHRAFWVYADIGAILIRAIARNLGPNWQHFMAWPLAQISEEGESRMADQCSMPNQQR
ncbi:hypothetical protein VPNG_09287 [Cytospora leucostoma]|uniref:Zn(2)-C6 fungal-type domain-containing protein n=1 Tax=Cytospora leucostoma TaxID=1230097 RepID=A0A423VV12_9PEZI|nr:hypothetical protein VPNG_09287 [Cytospora leucostoma]